MLSTRAGIASRFSIQSLTRRDIPAAAAIEEDCYAWEAWPPGDLLRVLEGRHSTIVGAWSKRGGHLAGYCAYEMHKQRYHLLNLAVAPQWQRQQVGTTLLAWFAGKLGQKKDRDEVWLEVRESNLVAQLFFQAAGYQLTETLPGWYGQGMDEDAYRFVYRRPQCLHSEVN